MASRHGSADTGHLRTYQKVEEAPPRRPRLLRCDASKPCISTQSASRDALISPASPTAVYLLNKMGGYCLNQSDAELVGEGLMKHNGHSVPYDEQSSPDGSINYRITCDSDSTPTDAYFSFPSFDNWASTEPSHSFIMQS